MQNDERWDKMLLNHNYFIEQITMSIDSKVQSNIIFAFNENSNS